MRNILAYVPQSHTDTGGARLCLIRKKPEEKTAGTLKKDFCREYENSYPEAAESLEEGCAFKVTGQPENSEYKHLEAA